MNHFIPRLYPDDIQAAERLHAEAGVEAIGVESGNDGCLIYGQCRESSSRLYRVNVWLTATSPDGAPSLKSFCVCGREGVCPHALALMLAGREFAAGHGIKLAQHLLDLILPLIFGRNLPGAGAVRPSAMTRHWLQGLEMSKPAPLSDQLLVFLLEPGQPGTLLLAKSRRLKRGGYGKPTPFALDGYDLSDNSGNKLVDECDKALLRLYYTLSLARTHYLNMLQPVPLDDTFAPQLLRQAAAIDLLFLTGEMGQPLRLGEAQPLKLVWQTSEAGLQSPSIELPAGQQLIGGPLWYVDPQNGVLGELVSPWSHELVIHLLNAPPLDDNDALIVGERLRHLPLAAGTPALPVPASVSADETLATPQVRLRLRMGRFRHQALASIDETWPIAELWFDYAPDLSVFGGEDTTPLVRLQRDGRWIYLHRDMEFERSLWRRLAGWGLAGMVRRLPNYRRIDSDAECLMPARNQIAGWLPLLEEGVLVLEQDGVTVEFDDDFPFRISPVDDWFIAVDEAENAAGWFDLDLGVVIGGQKVSLVPPLLALLKAQPDLPAKLKAMDEAETLPLPIDARRIVPASAGRLRAWLLPLLEFLDDDKPRIARHHAAALAACDDGRTQWLGGEALRALGEKLRAFTGLSEIEPAPGFNATLRPYQRWGLAWMQFLREHGLAGILADDMGLGKTVQTLSHLHLEKVSGRADRPSLVIAPTSLIANWRNEAAQFAPELKVLTLHGPERARLFGAISAADLVLTTYPLLVRDAEILRQHVWHLLILDEAQFIKNPKAQAHQVARQLDARHRLSLTGTPLENHLGELWAHFDFLMPGFLGNGQRFTRTFRVPIEKQGDTDARVRLHERVRPFLLRRTKEQVLSELPPRSEILRWVEIEGGQRDLYESLRVAFDKKLRQVLAEQGVGRSQIMILDALLKLRQVCCDPRLVKLPSAEALVKKGKVVSAKLAMLMDMLEELLDEGRRILLFSQFTSMLGLIEKELAMRKIVHVKLTGQTRDRETPIRQFQEGRAPLFLISLKAGGTGLNLTAADTVIHYDPWWNPAVEEQATARAHRIGQDKPVFVYKLLTQGTVEEKIQQLQQRKRHLTGAVVQSQPGGDGAGGGHLLTADDLDVLFEPM